MTALSFPQALLQPEMGSGCGMPHGLAPKRASSPGGITPSSALGNTWGLENGSGQSTNSTRVGAWLLSPPPRRSTQDLGHCGLGAPAVAPFLRAALWPAHRTAGKTSSHKCSAAGFGGPGFTASPTPRGCRRLSYTPEAGDKPVCNSEPPSNVAAAVTETVHSWARRVTAGKY